MNETAKADDLHSVAWTDVGRPVGTMLLVHGLSEHSGRYAGFAEEANAEGFTVHAVDLYGHGRSPGRRGHVRGFDVDHLRAVDRLMRATDRADGEIPRFLVGHSLGGLVALRWVQERVFADRLRGLALITPFFAPKISVPGWKRGIAALASRIKPTFTLPTNIPDELLFRDEAVRADFAADPHVQRRISARHWTELTAAREAARQGAAGVAIPTLMLLAGEDRVVSTDAARSMADLLPAAAVIEYPDAYHALHHDSGGRAVRTDLFAWARALLADR